MFGNEQSVFRCRTAFWAASLRETARLDGWVEREELLRRTDLGSEQASSAGSALEGAGQRR